MKATIVGPGPLTLTNILGTNDIELPAGRFAVVERPSGLAIAQTPGIEVATPKPQLLFGAFFKDKAKAERMANPLNFEAAWLGKAS